MSSADARPGQSDATDSDANGTTPPPQGAWARGPPRPTAGNSDDAGPQGNDAAEMLELMMEVIRHFFRRVALGDGTDRDGVVMAGALKAGTEAYRRCTSQSRDSRLMLVTWAISEYCTKMRLGRHSPASCNHGVAGSAEEQGRTSPGQPPAGTNGRRIFIANVGPATASELRTGLSRFGRVVDAYVHPGGYGFVEYSLRSSATRAVTAGGLEGESWKIEWAAPKHARRRERARRAATTSTSSPTVDPGADTDARAGPANNAADSAASSSSSTSGGGGRRRRRRRRSTAKSKGDVDGDVNVKAGGADSGTTNTTRDTVAADTHANGDTEADVNEGDVNVNTNGSGSGNTATTSDAVAGAARARANDGANAEVNEDNANVEVDGGTSGDGDVSAGVNAAVNANVDVDDGDDNADGDADVSAGAGSTDSNVNAAAGDGGNASNDAPVGKSSGCNAANAVAADADSAASATTSARVNAADADNITARVQDAARTASPASQQPTRRRTRSSSCTRVRARTPSPAPAGRGKRSRQRSTQAPGEPSFDIMDYEIPTCSEYFVPLIQAIWGNGPSHDDWPFGDEAIQKARSKIGAAIWDAAVQEYREKRKGKVADPKWRGAYVDADEQERVLIAGNHGAAAVALLQKISVLQMAAGRQRARSAPPVRKRSCRSGLRSQRRQ